VDALLLIDLQVGLCSSDGVAGAVLSGVVAERGTLGAAARCLAAARDAGIDVVHVRLAFVEGFARRTNRTERFDGHETAQRFLEGSPDVELCEQVAPRPGELVVSKGSVSPFAPPAWRPGSTPGAAGRWRSAESPPTSPSSPGRARQPTGASPSRSWRTRVPDPSRSTPTQSSGRSPPSPR